MKIASVKEREGSLQKLKSLLADKDRKVQGVGYTNSFFSQRYLCRSHVLVDDINISEDSVRLTFTTRVEQAGLVELETTLHMLTQFEAGDIPGFSPEGMYDIEEGGNSEFNELEPVSVTQFLTSVDILLNMKNPKVKYKDFTIAGSKFTLLELNEVFEDDFYQAVTLLFGDADKLYLLSHFYNKELNFRDMKMILDLFVDENLTGKAIRGIQTLLPNGVASMIYPYYSLIASYTDLAGDYVFGDGPGNIVIPADSLSDYTMSCLPGGTDGSYMLKLESKHNTIGFILE